MGKLILGRIVLCTLTLLLSVPALACCMVPYLYKGDVDQAGQEVVIMFHDGHQEMVIRVEPFFRDNINENGEVVLPEYIEWVVTVPKKPTGYQVASRDIFQDATWLATKLQFEAAKQGKHWLDKISPFATMGVDANAASDSFNSLDISDPVSVGPYEIVEVSGIGANAVVELNAYLTGRGYPKEDPDHLKWFIDNNFTFLCMHITPPKANTQLGERLDLEPLQIGFDVDEPYYPGKFSSRQGNFQLRLRVLTTQPLSTSGFSFIEENLKSTSLDTSNYINLWTARPLPESLGSAIEAANLDWKPKRWYVNSIDSDGFNKGDTAISTWQEDIFFALGDASDMPPDWYYGDGDKPFPTWLIWFIALVAILGGALLYHRNHRRKNAMQSRIVR